MRFLARSMWPVSLCVLLCTACGAPAEDWTRHSTDDGIISAEFPAAPVPEIEQSIHRLGLKQNDGAIYYSLSYSEAPSGTNTEKHLDSLRESMPKTMAKLGPTRLVKEEKIIVGGYPGRDFEFSTSDKTATHLRAIFVGERLYRVIAVTPVGQKDDPAPQRFIQSVQLNPPTQPGKKK